MKSLHQLIDATVWGHIVFAAVGESFAVDINNVYSVDQATVDAYASSNENTAFETAEEINLSNPFHFQSPELFPKTGSVALSGADFSGVDYNGYFEKVTYRGAFGSNNWMEKWTNFYPFSNAY